jgi:hypothetical protein
MRICSVEDCFERHRARGFCDVHYQRWRRGEGASVPKRQLDRGVPLEQRLLNRRQITPDGCWLWTGSTAIKGYGDIKVDGRTAFVHRLAYRIWVGPIPKGLTIDHLCRTRPCFNPEHLEAVTQRTNTLRGTGPSAKNARKTRCPQGHKYSGTNSQGTRICHKCIAANQRRYREEARQ